MTEIDFQLIRDTTEHLVSRGFLSAACIDEIKTLTVKNENKELSSKSTSKWVTRQEAADILKVSVMSVIRYGKMGKIQFKKLAGQRLTRYRLSDIEAMINAE